MFSKSGLKTILCKYCISIGTGTGIGTIGAGAMTEMYRNRMKSSHSFLLHT